MAQWHGWAHGCMDGISWAHKTLWRVTRMRVNLPGHAACPLWLQTLYHVSILCAQVLLRSPLAHVGLEAYSPDVRAILDAWSLCACMIPWPCDRFALYYTWYKILALTRTSNISCQLFLPSVLMSSQGHTCLPITSNLPA